MQTPEQQTRDFTVMIAQYERIIHKVCGLYVTEQDDYKDLYQEIVLQTWIAYPKFRNEAKISTWLYRISLNTAINYKRIARKKMTVFQPLESLVIPADANPEKDENYQLLWHLISKLPELDRALVLLYLEDNSYDEIASIMGLSVTNVGTKLGRIKEKLKKQAQIFQQ